MLSQTDAKNRMIPVPRPRLLAALDGEVATRPPIWFMRQAGRSLPEYRLLRERAPDFMAFCLDPEMAAEATLQPMRRFDFDAAIVFADILLIPMALGQKVWFEAGEGPRLGELPEMARLRGGLADVESLLAPVSETIRRVRAGLDPSRALIGFAGGPWTVATYMLEGRGGDRSAARATAFSRPEFVDELIDLLVEASAGYLAMQARSGAQALQLFESWAELLPEDMFDRLVTRPHARIVARLRQLGVGVPVIGFPRGAGALVEEYAAGANVQCIGLDVQASAALGRRLQSGHLAIQGALDPLLLRAGGPNLEARVHQLLAQWGSGPYVFNLGHGVLPDTPLANIEQAVRLVTGP